MRKTRHVVLMAAILGLAACAGMRQRTPAPRLTLLRSLAGKPLASFHLLRPLYAWESIDDTHLLVYTRPRQAYLLEVAPCPDLGSSFAIGLTTHTDDVVAGLDEVVVRGSGIGMPCTIGRIRAVDVKALREAGKRPPKPREMSTLPRAAAPGTPAR